MARKQRPTAVDEFRRQLNKDDDLELIRLLRLPGITGIEIYNYLNTLGYNGSLKSVYNWYSQQKVTGEKAEQINELLKDYQGIEVDKVLEKLLGLLTQQLDVAIGKLTATNDIQGQDLPLSEYVRTLPQLGRELRGCIQLANSLQFVKDKRSLELGGAFRMGKELEDTFKDSPFYDALCEAITAAMEKFEGDG